MLTAERLRELLDYDPETGVFVWRTLQPWHTRRNPVAGARMGAEGRVIISIEGRRHLRSRLAWLYMTGEWPASCVDHEDTDPSNDRWSNLRIATPVQNGCNRPRQRNNTTGFKGVTREKSTGKFVAQIFVRKRHIMLGRFLTAEAAHAAYCRAAEDLHGEFARTV